MIVDCISDLHGFYPQLEGGDLLVIAGDLTACDRQDQYQQFAAWLLKQSYKMKIVVAGNHDNGLVGAQAFADSEYLMDDGVEFGGLNIWGSPWTRTFFGMNPHCKAFTLDTEKEMSEKFALIPDDTDILVTHSPPYGTLDSVDLLRGRTSDPLGSTALRDALDRVKPKLHVFGHIHGPGGHRVLYKHGGANTWCVNASIMDEGYNPINKPIRIEL